MAGAIDRLPHRVEFGRQDRAALGRLSKILDEPMDLIKFVRTVMQCPKHVLKQRQTVLGSARGICVRVLGQVAQFIEELLGIVR